jgi:uncharacterized protein
MTVKYFMYLELITIPIVTIFLAQMLKLATDDYKGNFNIINIFGRYGGMPSTHATYLASLGTLLAWGYNFNSAAFALWFMLTVIVLRDAMGLRQEVSRHTLAIEEIAKKTNFTIPKLTRRVGHKPIEVIAGTLFGISITIIIKFILIQYI